ncbi:hypothetical protein SAMN05216188_101435 [Lentzea xinjiangensis]|uniref:Uncharacterized protein n=1 Tax=Lentzea xinjiangensis TaxID=402600 RepID=A0A1H9AKU6_9PSEU|nr:hypothetical protein [Lentzea xinjiangensis]SEP77097.1 hypothetical protein SAMN05216188_101435 [Lentzea xinjiangensis]
MDEQKLADLFRDAAHDAPPASFDAGDVRTASRRAALRRRNSIAAGTTLAVVLGFGGAVAATGWFGQDGRDTLNSAGQQEKDTAQSPLTELMTPQQAQPPTKNFPGDHGVSTQGDPRSPGSTGPSAGDRAVQGCAGVDRELADALAGELSVSPDFAEPPAVTCSPDSRSAAFRIDGLTVTAIVTPQPFEAPVPAAKVRTAKGQDLYVFTQGDGELEDRAKPIADALAPGF